jgi:hypothetical protein
MNREIKITCDRCKNEVIGLYFPETYYCSSYTAGFYDVSEGAWKEYCREGEILVCDTCMQKDENWSKIYSPVNVEELK